MKKWVAHFLGGKDGERGIEIIEFMGILPIILMVAMIIWQFITFAHVAFITASAAREGARAAATYENAYDAVARTVGDYDFTVMAGACGGAGSPVRVRVRLRIPIIDIFFVPLPEMWTDHTAVCRCEPLL
jgi:pilus assembly protein CpaE